LNASQELTLMNRCGTVSGGVFCAVTRAFLRDFAIY
jgi:hypothetical protein